MPEHVLVVGAARAQRRGRRRRASADSSVAVTRATLIAADPLAGDAGRWLEEADLEEQAATAIAALNRVVDLHRIAAADASVPPLSRARCLVVRVGTGAGDQVADGHWTRAVVLAAPPAPRREQPAGLLPQERLGAILGGRDVALACELLALRARSDLDAGRLREAAFQLRVTLEATLAELVPWSGQGDIDTRLSELGDLRGSVGDVANAALQGGLDGPRTAAMTHALERIEAALRARTHAELSA